MIEIKYKIQIAMHEFNDLFLFAITPNRYSYRKCFYVTVRAFVYLVLLLSVYKPA